MTTDPLDVLRGPAPIVRPDPDFVARLRAELDALSRTDQSETRPPTTSPTQPHDTSLPGPDPVEIDMTTTLLPARRRPLLLGAVAAVALLMTGIIAVLASDGDNDQPGDTPTTTLPLSLTPIASVATATAPTGLAPWTMTAAGGSLWVVNSPGSALERRNADTGALLATIAMPFDVYADAPRADSESLWVETEADGKVRRINLTTGEVTATVDIPDGIKPVSGDEPPGIAVDDQGAWVISGGLDRALTLVDRTTNAVTSRFPMTMPHPSDLAAGFGSLWVAASDRQLHRIDPADGHTIATIPLATATGVLAVGDDAVWVLGPDQAFGTSLQRINPTTNTVDATIAISAKRPEIVDLTIDDGYVWIRATPPDARLVKIDAATNQIVTRYSGPTGGEGIAITGHSAWVLSAADHTLYRIPTTSP